MKKILFTLLALALLPVFVFAQDCPTPASATATVTFKRKNTGPVLDGIFSVGSGSTVKFSRGNLQYQANSNTWQFAAHQYDMIGADNGNISSTYAGWIDLFGWATNASAGNGTHYQPWDSSTDDAYGNIVASSGWDNLESSEDWASNIGTGWRTLSSTEWDYLLNTRTTAATVNGTSDARWSVAQISAGGNTISGLILFPDNFAEGTPTGVSWGGINAYEYPYTVSTCTADGWAALEDAGCVFLPCAGYRDGISISNVGSEGFYWTATSSTPANAVALHFPSHNLFPGHARHLGHSVRLVHVVE